MGKASIIFIAGLSLIVTTILMRVGKTSTDSADSYSEYYGRTMAHNIALAGANVGTQLLLADPTYKTARKDSFGGGSYSFKIDSLNPQGDRRLTVSAQIRLYDNISEKSTIGDTVKAVFRRTPFSKYGYFSESERNVYRSPTSNTTSGGNMWKTTGDSIFGPAHTNLRWNLGGTPYFHDKVTAGTSPLLSGGPGGAGNPVYNAGYQWGITVSRPAARLNELEALASSNGRFFNGGSDVGLTFDASGSVRVKIPWSTGAVRDTVYASIAALAPNGIIVGKSIDIRVQGTYQGQATVVARTGTSTGALKGNVWFQDNLVAATNPATNPNSTDMMGIVAERMAYIATTGVTRTSASTTTVQAAIYTHNGTFSVENYNGCGVHGKFFLHGGLALSGSTNFNTVSGGSITNGMSKNFRHDSRFLTQSPPYFPFSDKYELVSWWEK